MDVFTKLKEWLNKENDHLMMYEKGSRGIYSTKDIKKNDIIISIPEKYIIEYSKIKDNKLVNKLNNMNSMIALYLYQNFTKKKSFWKPYLDTLPNNLDEYIYYYDKKKLNSLKGTSILCKDIYNYDTHIKYIIEDSKIVYEYLNMKDKTYEEFYPLFLKCRIYACSRIFGYMKNNKDDFGLVPYADLLNHSQNYNTQWDFNDNTKCFEVIATKNIKANSEIYDSYGEKTNFELLLYYGFTVKNNIYSELVIKHKNEIYKISKKSINKNNILYRDPKFIDKLNAILEKHQNKIKEIKDQNILNIYNDEINIIKSIIKLI